MDNRSRVLHTFISLVHLHIRVNSPIITSVHDIITPSFPPSQRLLVYTFGPGTIWVSLESKPREGLLCLTSMREQKLTGLKKLQSYTLRSAGFEKYES